MEESAARITGHLLQQSAVDTPVVVLAHNGRLGLGGARRDLCGVDWKQGAGVLTPSSSGTCAPAGVCLLQVLHGGLLDRTNGVRRSSFET